jgi:hypothetical protein
VTVKELKHMLENADDNAIVVVRNNWAPAEFLNASARKMVLVKTNGKLMTPKWAEASGYICEGPAMSAILFD